MEGLTTIVIALLLGISVAVKPNWLIGLSVWQWKVLGAELIPSKKTETVTRIFGVVFTAVVLLLIWAELAVGIFGTPWAGS